MISVKSLQQVQIVLRTHDTALNDLRSRNQDYTGRRITNAGDAVDPQDYVTLRQLPSIVTATSPNIDQNLAIVFSFGSAMPTGSLISSPYVPGEFRTGIPQWVRLVAAQAPSGGPLNCNISWRRTGSTTPVNILTSDISVPSGSVDPVKSIMFISPIPFFDVNDSILPTCESANGAGYVSLIVGIKRKING